MTDITPQAPPETPIIKLLDRERYYPAVHDATVFAHPRGARILTPPDGKQFKVSIPTALVNWWVLPLILIPALIAVALPVSIAMSFVAPTWERHGYFTPLPMLIAAVIVMGASWIIWRLCFPRIVIEATRESVTVGKYKFDWRTLGGFRIGHSAGGIERENTQWRFQGIIMEYGPYGFDLPYMVRKYYAAHYVIWLNDLLATIGKGEKSGTHDPKSGFKKSLF